ncbi:MAG: hypothetical protein ACRC8O_01445 [Plesiomonas shigelloides]
MKKTILAVATLSVLMASCMANAAYTDADKSGSWSGNLNFNGTISNTGPSWKYQIPDDAVVAAKDWNTERSSAAVSGQESTFSFPDKDFTLLMGVMKAPAVHNGAGMQPVVTFGSGSDALVWDTATETGTIRNFDFHVDVKNNDSNTVGQLVMTVITQSATQAVDAYNGAIASDSSFNNAVEAFKLLKSQDYYLKSYDKHNVRDLSTASSTSMLNDTNSYNTLSAALVAKVNTFELKFPTTAIPETWSATLPISITVK